MLPRSSRPWSWSASIERLDQHLDGLANLIPKLVGDLLLVLGTLGQQRFERVAVCHAEEPLHAQQAAEGPQGDRFFQPERGVPGGIAGGFVAGSIDQHPPLAVGDQAQPHVRGVQQFHHPGVGRCLPVRPGTGFLQVLARRVDLDQQPSLTRIGPPGRIHDHQIGPQGLAMLGDDGLERLLDALALGDHLVGKLQHLLQHELDPGHDGWPDPVARPLGYPPTPREPAQDSRCRSGSWATSPWGNTRISTGMERNGPETSTSESHSAW